MNTFVSGESDASGQGPHIAFDRADVAIRRPGYFYNHPTMKTLTINAFKTITKLNETKELLLKIHEGYPLDSEFEDTIELIDAFMHGLGPVNEVLERQGMSNLGMREVVDRMNQRILHFYNLGKP